MGQQVADGHVVRAGDEAGADCPFRFAGEHTSINNIGFLDGAVETGERAARLVFGRIGL